MITGCRICGSDKFESIIDLGDIYQSKFLLIPSENNLKTYPLKLIRCKQCGLVQLADTAPMDSMYREYWYKSSLNGSMVASLNDIVNDISTRKKLDGVIVDIGCNDGTLLNLCPNSMVKIGFDPALNLYDEAFKSCDYFINDYFSSDKMPDGLKADIVTSIAMFYDLPDPNWFVENVKSIMKDDAIWVIQFMDLKSMIEACDFTNICHEHIEYYDLLIVHMLLESHGLRVFKVSKNSTNGGSIRIFVSKPGAYLEESSVEDMLGDENIFFANKNVFMDFEDSIHISRKKINDIIYNASFDDADIYGLGASTKANTFLQYYGINSLVAIGDINSDKFGRFTVGTHIPIVPESAVLDEQPPYILLLIYQFEDFMLKRLSNYIKNGGCVIVPLPKVHIVSRDGIRYI